MTHVLFWDIDGTLLTTARAGILAWEEATRQVAGKTVDLQTLETAGLTDVEIAIKILNSNGVKPIPDAVDRLLRAYESYLPDSLTKKRGHVMPGVREVLDYLSARTDALCLLLTGNTRLGAAAKLKHYGLDQYFSAGAFAEDSPQRESIARVALETARRIVGSEVPSNRMYVIGDTPYDIQSGKSIGARTAAVATGVYSAPQLLEYKPWLVLEHLPDPKTFARLVELPS